MSKKQPKVILTEHLDDECADWIAERVNLVRQSHDDFAALKKQLATAEGLIVRTYTQVNDALLDAAPKLKVVGRAGVGLDNIDLPACEKRGVRVVYTPDANTQAVVEYIWALIADAKRPRVYLDGYVAPPKFHELRATHVGRQLNEQVLGILGMGRIGRRVAEVARAMGVRVIYNDVRTRAELALPDDDTSEFVDTGTLWRDSDILTVHVDGRPSNRGFIDAKKLGQLKKSVLLLNTSRGFVIDPQALAKWSHDVVEHGGMAVLDVHEPEPMPDDYPLFGLPNVKLLPHLASRTHQAMRNMSWVVQDVLRVLEGDEPMWPAV
ncbi:MAG: hydroxyacid dehydrogenase [Phycisphaera sp.]|nr:hydroxyacid dehydrogenase [Phycisphaera sp.]